VMRPGWPHRQEKKRGHSQKHVTLARHYFPTSISGTFDAPDSEDLPDGCQEKQLAHRSP
jgi:hypothetical protein